MPGFQKFINYILLFAVAIFCSAQSSCQQAATFYDSPIGKSPKTRQKEFGPKKLYSNLGEFRGAKGDETTWFGHGATDFKIGRTNVYSPDVGEVQFFGAGNVGKNAGMPPVKIGHFGLHHFNNTASLPIDPRTLGDPKAKTFIVNPGDPIFVIKGGGPVQANLKKKAKFAKGVWQNPADNKWYPAFYYNRLFPIGQTTGPDLHVTYYDSVTAGFRSRANLRNALSVFRYKNSKPPAISHFRLFSQSGSTQVTTKGNKKFIADNIKNNQGTMDIPKDKGVDIVITTASFGQNSNSVSGIYKLSYTVYKILIPGDTPPGPVINIGGKRAGEYKAQSIMHTYDRLLPPNQDKQVIAHRPYYVPPTNGPASLYTDVNKNKHTSFVVSNLSGDDTNHWELEDTGAFPDGEYIVRVRAWNIAKSNGEGNAPNLNEKTMDTKVLIETNVPKKLRYITIQKP